MGLNYVASGGQQEIKNLKSAISATAGCTGFNQTDKSFRLYLQGLFSSRCLSFNYLKHTSISSFLSFQKSKGNMKGMLAILNLGGPEIVLIVFVVVLLFGAKRIPELARGLEKE